MTDSPIDREELENNTRFEDPKTNRKLKVVAEGDSWFAYPFVADVVDHLRRMKWVVKRRASAGDTLENMVYGTEYHIRTKENRVVNLGTRDLDDTLSAIRKHQPQFVLFSAGGNDIVGADLIFYLNHKRRNLPLIREEVVRVLLSDVVKPAIAAFCEAVWAEDASIHILMDGYDYAKPNGTSYAGITGPWILPSMGAKAIVDREEQEAIVKYLVDGFNELLKNLDAAFSNFHHIDLRGMFPNDDQWHNEIHLRGPEYGKVAERYHEKMVELLGEEPG